MAMPVPWIRPASPTCVTCHGGRVGDVNACVIQRGNRDGVGGVGVGPVQPWFSGIGACQVLKPAPVLVASTPLTQMAW